MRVNSCSSMVGTESQLDPPLSIARNMDCCCDGFSFAATSSNLFTIIVIVTSGHLFLHFNDVKGPFVFQAMGKMLGL